MVLIGVAKSNQGLGFLQETYLTDGVYTCGSDGCSIVAMDAPIQHCGRVAVFYRATPRYMMQ